MSSKFSRNAFPAPPLIRRDPRDIASIFIVVSGFDRKGHFFTEHTATTNVSDNGCCFRLNREVPVDALLALQTLEQNSDSPSPPTLFQIAWMERLPKGATVGAARLHGEANWYMALPAASDQQTPKA
jgi:hypothetical protein